MVRLIVTLIELIFCFLLQTSLFSFMRISGVVPNCLLILVITVSYTRGQIPAMVTGFFAGMFLDLCFSETVGFCAILYMIVAFLAGYAIIMLLSVTQPIIVAMYFSLCALTCSRINHSHSKEACHES